MPYTVTVTCSKGTQPHKTRTLTADAPTRHKVRAVKDQLYNELAVLGWNVLENEHAERTA